MIKFTSTIKQLVINQTTDTPPRFSIECYGEGTEYECNTISKLMFQRKIKAEVYAKETYRSTADIAHQDDMVKVDLRLTVNEFGKLLRLLDA